MMTLPSILAAFEFEGITWPWALVWGIPVALGIGVLIWTYHDIFRRTGRALVWWLLGLRGLGLLLLVLMLARPTWTREAERVEPAHVAVVVDTSRSMSLADETGKPRYDRVQRAVERLTRALADRPGPRLAIDLFDMNGERLRDGLPATPAGDSSRLLETLGKVRNEMKADPLAAMVLISDGMDTTGRKKFNQVIDRKVRVHALGFKETEIGDLDLAVAAPQVAGPARVHNAVEFQVPVTKTGQAPVEATVSIKHGRDVLAKKTVEFPAGKKQLLVPLTYTWRQQGSFVLTASVESKVAERKPANNNEHFPLQVDAEKIRVLYLEGFLRDESKFLRRQLEDDPDVALTSSVRRSEEKFTRGLLAADRLKEYDVVILGDMEGSALSADEYQQLLKWLDGKNHSLLVLGGYYSFSPTGFRDTPLAARLPVIFADNNKPYQSEEPFELQLTDRGRRLPIFALSGDRDKDAEAWSRVGRLQGMSLVQGLKEGAEELAVNPEVKVGGKPAVVMAAQRAPGGGQVLVLTMDTTWRWSRLPRVLGQADVGYMRFWGQTIRWLAGRSAEDQRPLLTVSTDKPDYNVGDKVQVRLEHQGNAPGEEQPQMGVEITSPRGEVLPALKLKIDEGNRAARSAEFYPESGGRYEVAARLIGSDKKLLANQTAEFMVQGKDLELADVSVNPKALRAIADANRGTYFEIDQAEKLAAVIPPEEQRTPEPKKSEFWNSPWLFAGFILAVAAEWLLRRRNHLV
jgi:hypothetical protein